MLVFNQRGCQRYVPVNFRVLTPNYGSPGGTFLLITYYLLLITYHLLLITYYLSLITYYLLLIISFITPITAGNSKYTFPVTAVALVVVVVVVVVAIYL